MNLDIIIPVAKTEDDLINQVVENAKADVTIPVTKTSEEDNALKFETEDSEFGTENKNEGEVKTDQPKPAEEKPKSATATIVDKLKVSTTEPVQTALSEQEQKRNVLYCELYVLMAGEGVEMLSKWISGEWDVEGKYALAKTKQKEIAKAWADVLNMEMKTKSPRGALVMLFVACFLPILLMAGKTYFHKWQQRKKDAKNQKALAVQKTEVKPVQQEMKTVVAATENFSGPTAKEIAKAKEIELKKEDKKTFVAIDRKGTAKVLKSSIKKPEQKKEPGMGKRGRKSGSAKNPNTGEYELYTEIKEVGGVPYYVFSWGEEKVIPLKHRI